MRCLHQKLFLLLVLLLPVQLGRHFWPEWSYVFGLRIDYLAPTVYLTDILVIGILGLWGWDRARNAKHEARSIFQNLKRLFFPISVSLFLLVNAFLAQNQTVALYKFAKIIEFTFLGFYVAKNHYQLSAISYQLFLGVIYSSLIAIVQFLKQSSLNGIFWWLGERAFSISTPGIAKAIVGGRLVMRPYATFPHPNVLAGFTLVSLVLVLANFNSRSARDSIPDRNQGFSLWAIRDWVFNWAVLILGTIVLAISFSRTAWLIGFAVGLWVVVAPRMVVAKSTSSEVRKRKRKMSGVLITIYSLLIAGLVLYFLFRLPFSSSEAFTQRLQLAKAAILMIKESPLIGVGLNNFLIRLPDLWQEPATIRLFQPVHNIFLLIAAETGLVGLTIFLWFLILTYRRLRGDKVNPDPGIQDKVVLADSEFWKRKMTTVSSSSKVGILTALSGILLLGFFDHYFFTLQQTQLLLALVLGLSWGLPKGKINKQGKINKP